MNTAGALWEQEINFDWIYLQFAQTILMFSKIMACHATIASFIN
jgi:hypothetical protein